jgi:uncharacterized protein YecE (DUF72 family)
VIQANKKRGFMIMIKIGCCGFSLSRKKYFETFEIVEIQQTFYQPPQLATAIKWRREAPQGFVYTMKAWQLITHTSHSPTYRRLSTPIPESQQDCYGSFQPTDEVHQAWQKTLELARVLAPEIILFQCPASFKPTSENIDNLYRFFSTIPREGFSLAWEPRGSWRKEEIKDLCQQLDLIYAFDPFKTQPGFTQPVLYLRLHGRTGYRYQYTDSELEFLAQQLSPDATNYVLFNNSAMVQDALRFIRIVQGN